MIDIDELLRIMDGPDNPYLEQLIEDELDPYDMGTGVCHLIVNDDHLFDPRAKKMFDANGIPLPTEHTLSKIKAIKMCGTYFTVFSPVSGTPQRKQYTCKFWRECEKCGKRRAEKEMRELEQAYKQYALAEDHIADLAPVKLRMLETTVEHFNAIKGDLGGRDKYRAYPQDSDSDDITVSRVIVFIEPHSNLGIPISREELENLDWTKITNTKPNHNKSGVLGRDVLATTNSKENSTRYTVINTIITEKGTENNIDALLEHQLLVEAALRTQELNPQTPEEVQDALNKRSLALANIAREKGYSIVTYSSVVYILSNNYNWLIYIDKILNRHKYIDAVYYGD